MAAVGFHASHELYPPSELLRLTRLAQEHGFRHVMCSDHFHPWTPSQGQSGYAWSWLGAAMQATETTFGTVCAPGQRYHPAIIAQASATLAEMFPERLWVALGSGQALSESITGDPWPPKAQRHARLLESVAVIRALWAGETVTHEGLIRVKDAKLYTRPKRPPMIFGAAISLETAAWVGRWADGLITVAAPQHELKQKVDAFREAAGADKPVFVQAAISYSPDEEESVRAARANWPICGLEVSELEDLPTPQSFAERCCGVTLDVARSRLRSSSNLDQHIEWIAGDLEAGATRIYLHHVGPDMDRFVGSFADRVLPYL